MRRSGSTHPLAFHVHIAVINPSRQTDGAGYARVEQPLTDRTIYDRQPTKDEEKDRTYSCSFSETSNHEDTGDDGEHGLVDAEE